MKTEKVHKFSPATVNNTFFNSSKNNFSQSKILSQRVEGQTLGRGQHNLNNNRSQKNSQKSFQIKQMIKKICENGNEGPQANKPPLFFNELDQKKS